MKKNMIITASILLLCVVAGTLFCGSSKNENINLAVGKVASVTSSSLTVLVMKTDTVIMVDSKTKFKGVKDLSEVKDGDTVIVKYMTAGNGSNIALSIKDKKQK